MANGPPLTGVAPIRQLHPLVLAPTWANAVASAARYSSSRLLCRNAAGHEGICSFVSGVSALIGFLHCGTERGLTFATEVPTNATWTALF
jgi:hypothetical protein